MNTQCLLGLLLVLAPTASAAGEPTVAFGLATVGGHRQRVETLVAGARTPASAEAAARHLARLGPDALPDLVAALGHRRADDPRRAALVGALDLHGRTAVLPHLAPANTAAPNLRAASLLALGGIGGSGDLDRMLALAADAGRGAGAVRPELHEALLEGSSLLWTRHAPTAAGLRDAIRAQEPDVAAALVQAACRVSGEPVLTAFEALLGRRSEIDRGIVPRLPALARDAGRPLRPDTLARLREMLDHADVELARSAAVALAQLEDLEAVGELVGALRSGEPRLVDSARWALVELTGMGYGATPEPWEAWYAEQADWYANRAPEVLRMLDDPRAGPPTQALRELSARPLFRADLAPAIAGVLERPEPQLRLLGCSTLRRLGSDEAKPLLVRRLADTDPRVVETSHAALVELTGLDLPPDARRWQDALESGGAHATRR